MKLYPIFTILAFGASLAISPSKSETLTNYYTGDHVHTYVSPYVSITAGFQAGKNNNLSVDQSSHTNIFAVTQLGPHNVTNLEQGGSSNKAILKQDGIANFSATSQYGDNNRARLRQTGPLDLAVVNQVAYHSNSSTIVQIYHAYGWPSSP